MDGSVEVPAVGGLTVYPRSPVAEAGTTYFLGRHRDGPRALGVLGDVAGFVGVVDGPSGALLCPLTGANAVALRGRLPWLRPALLGVKTSAGFGDRLGLATPGHVRALRETPAAAELIGPIFAQQSVRENRRTGRTPQRVMDDATWGVFQEGWRAPWGADADHLKSPADIGDFADAGYTLYTVDPGDHVDETVEGLSEGELEARFRAAPWEALEDSPRDLERRYLGRPVDLQELALTVDGRQLRRAVAKYGHAVAHTVAMYRRLVDRLGRRGFELEVSVDETASPTTVAEHLYIAGELHRLGVAWVSLAPRFCGRFEKGVDYIGDVEAFAADCRQHAAVARALGPYKLSLHSGSDKFSLYPLVARLAGGRGSGRHGPLVHLKTAGTSYLEALRAVARVEPALFREVLGLARDRYEADRLTYHVSATVAGVASPQAVRDPDLADLLESFDVRQVLHVTFGSVLDALGDRLRTVLTGHEALYSELLAGHFTRHLEPFAVAGWDGG